MRARTASTASLSVVSVSALTRCTRSWFLRSIETGPVPRSTTITFLAGSTWPPACSAARRRLPTTSSRSAWRSRTTIGYSLPASRNIAACVPATLVRIVLATPVTVRPSSAALSRSTRTASSGRPSSRCRRESAMPGVESSIVLRSCAMLFEVSRSWPRISIDSRPSPPPPPMPRIMLFWPPDGRARTMTPGMPDSSRRSIIEICSLERSRSSRGTSRMLTLPRCIEPPPKPPPPPPPPAWLMKRTPSGTSCLTRSSTPRITASVRSMREPTASSTSTWTSPSSVCGWNSKPMLPSSTIATANSAKPVANTVGRCASARCSMRA